MSDILLDIKNLNIVYSTTDGVVRALNDANLQIRRGEALGFGRRDRRRQNDTRARYHATDSASARRNCFRRDYLRRT